MKYITNNSNDTAYNIALEEFAFKQLLKENKIFLLWINKPSIIVGRHQNTIQEINLDFVRENGIEVVRRISGGGAVYHDYNNLNYTIITQENENKIFDFQSFSTPVIQTLESLGVKAKFTGRNDLEIDGKKICGNAQAYINGRIMHHGCLLFDVNLSALSKALKVSDDKIKSKSVKSVRSRVTNIIDKLPKKITIEEFKRVLLDNMKLKYPEMTEYVLSDEEIFKIKQAKREKFGNWNWNYGKSPEYNIKRNTKFANGKIEIYANIVESKIQNIKIYGDFFGIEDISIVEDILCGIRYERNTILNTLDKLCLSKYFLGFTTEEVTSAIVN